MEETNHIGVYAMQRKAIEDRDEIIISQTNLMIELCKQIEELKEYKRMYEDLCK